MNNHRNIPKPGLSPIMQKLLNVYPPEPSKQAFDETAPTIEIDHRPGMVKIEFSKSCKWAVFNSTDARSIGAAMIKHANLADGLNEDGSPKIIVPPSGILLAANETQPGPRAEICEHGKSLAEYCEACGRIHSA